MAAPARAGATRAFQAHASCGINQPVVLVPWPSGKARVCKTLIPRFKSGRHLEALKPARRSADDRAMNIDSSGASAVAAAESGTVDASYAVSVLRKAQDQQRS